jgi:hypothetical protein
MPKLSVYEAIFIEREVEIPEKCPQCGESFTGGSGLLEVDWVNLEMAGHVKSEPKEWGGDWHFNARQHHEIGDEYRASLFQCAACLEVIQAAGNCVIGKDRPVNALALAGAYREAKEG